MIVIASSKKAIAINVDHIATVTSVTDGGVEISLGPHHSVACTKITVDEVVKLIETARARRLTRKDPAP